MEVLAQWPNGWKVIAEADESFISLTRDENNTPSPNATWDLSDEEDLVERRVIFADLLDRLIEATIIDTEHVSGLVVDISGYDYLQIGNVRGEFILKSEDTGQTYIGNGENLEEVVTALRAYTPEVENSDDSDQPTAE